jgi:hypothetical protein
VPLERHYYALGCGQGIYAVMQEDTNIELSRLPVISQVAMVVFCVISISRVFSKIIALFKGIVLDC